MALFSGPRITRHGIEPLHVIRTMLWVYNIGIQLQNISIMRRNTNNGAWNKFQVYCSNPIYSFLEVWCSHNNILSATVTNTILHEWICANWECSSSLFQLCLEVFCEEAEWGNFGASRDTKILENCSIHFYAEIDILCRFWFYTVDAVLLLKWAWLVYCFAVSQLGGLTVR